MIFIKMLENSFTDSQVLPVFPKFRRTQKYEYLIKITNIVNSLKESILSQGQASESTKPNEF